MTRSGVPARPPRPGGCKHPSHLSPPLSRGGRFARLEFRFITSLPIGVLENSAFRAFCALLACVSYWREEVNGDGTFPLRWHRAAYYSKPTANGVGIGRVTKAHIARFLEVGLLEDLIEDETGEEFLRFRDWPSLRAGDPTGAERAARWRERHGLYGRRPRRPDDPPRHPMMREIAPHHEEGS